MDENNSKEVEYDLENKNATEENIENPDPKEVVKVQKNIEKNVEKNIEKKKVIKEAEKKDRNGSKKDNRDVYIQYRKPSVFSSVLLILIGALLATIAFLIIYVFIIDKGEEVDIYKETENEIEVVEDAPEEKKKIDISEDLVKSLYQKIPMQFGSVEVYRGSLTTAKDIEDNYKLLFVIELVEAENKYEEITNTETVVSKLDNKLHLDEENKILGFEESVKKIDFDIVKEKYQSIFGLNEEIPLIDADTNTAYVYEYCPEDKCFYGHSYYGGGGGGYAYYNQFTGYEQNEDRTELYLYDNFIMLDMVSNEYNILSTSDYINKTGLIEENITRTYENNITLYDGRTEKQMQEYYFNNNCGKFKHTFKLDDSGNYYWYSSEKIN